LALGLQIIPVLVLEAGMPSADALPPSIAQLSRRNAIQITSTHYKTDVARLIRAVEHGRHIREAMTSQNLTAAGPDPRRAPRLLGDRYELVSLLGSGSGIAVHRAVDTRLGRDVTLWLLSPEPGGDPEFPMRLHREARRAAALRHPAIAAIHETGEVDTGHGRQGYLVMEYVNGRSLRDVVATTGPLPEQRVIDVMIGICTALDVGHQFGIVHGDLSLDSVMIDQTGAVKVLNFGLASAFEPVRRELRDDVHAAGRVLFELITGQPPTGAPRDAAALAPPVPPALAGVVRRALSTNPATAHPTAGDLRNDLARAVDAPPAGPSPGSPRPSRPTQQIEAPTGWPSRAAAAAPPAAKRGGRRREPQKTAIALLAVLIAVGLVGGVAYRQLYGSAAAGTQRVAVPRVAGLGDAEASAQLAAAGLLVERRSQPVAAAALDGTVLACDPDAGTLVAAGSSVTITLGAAPGSQPSSTTESTPARARPSPPRPTATPRVTVPSVIGFDADPARRELAAAGLAVDTQDVDSRETPGSVIGTDPAAGTEVAAGTTVTMRIAVPREPIPLPSVVGMSESEAKEALAAAGFKNVNTQYQPNGDLGPNGSVLKQDPEGGTVLDIEEPVTLLVGTS
jgi:serine/threonine-protein kinase